MWNWFKTGILLAMLSALFLVAGNYLAGPQGVRIALVLALALNLGSYWFSDRVVLALYRARPLSEEESPALHRLVGELCERAGIPKPRLYLLDMDTPNAFATGRNPDHAAVAVTRGLLGILDSRELAGVLAHELSHVKHRDTLVSTIAASIASAISYLTYLGLFFGGSRDERGRGNPAMALLMFIVAPLVAGLIQMAVSRSREYAADERGARIAGEAGGLASALVKLQASSRARPFRGAQATQHLFIVNPFRGQALASLFATHPSTEDRVRRLNALAAELGG